MKLMVMTYQGYIQFKELGKIIMIHSYDFISAFQLDRENINGVDSIEGTTAHQTAYRVKEDSRLIIDTRYLYIY